MRGSTGFGTSDVSPRNYRGTASLCRTFSIFVGYVGVRGELKFTVAPSASFGACPSPVLQRLCASKSCLGECRALVANSLPESLLVAVKHLRYRLETAQEPTGNSFGSFRTDRTSQDRVTP